MSISVNDGGVLHKLSAIPTNDGGVLRPQGLIKTNDGGVLKTIFTLWKEPTISWCNPDTGEAIFSGNSGIIPECTGSYNTDKTTQTIIGNWNLAIVKVDYDLKWVSSSYNQPVVITLRLNNSTIGTLNYDNSWHISGSVVINSPSPFFLEMTGNSTIPPLTVNFKFSKV